MGSLNVYLFTIERTDTGDKQERHVKARTADEASEIQLKRRWCKDFIAESAAPLRWHCEELVHNHIVDTEGKAFQNALTVFERSKNLEAAIKAYMNTKELWED